jgi:protein-histidine pros-kinase
VYLLVAVFLFLFITVNHLLSFLVVRRVRKLAKIADQVSLGSMDAPEFPTKGSDEVAALGASFNRMRRSLLEAINMLQ